MKLSAFPILAFAISLLLTGCGKTVLVTRGPQLTAPPLKTQAVDGIPFYVKRAYCQQKASWIEPQYSIAVTATVDSQPAHWLDATAVLSRSQFLHDPALPKLLESSGKDLDVKSEEGCTTYLRIQSLTERMRKSVPHPVDDADLTTAVRDGDLTLAENSASVITYVDYQTVYYYNAARPVTGTSQIDLKLATDGTLTEGNSSVNDQTLSSITGVFSSALAGAGAAAIPMVSAAFSSDKPVLPQPCQQFSGTRVRYDATYAVHIYSHTHLFKDAAAAEPSCNPRPLASASFCGEGCSLQITEVAVTPAVSTKTDPPPAAKPAPK